MTLQRTLQSLLKCSPKVRVVSGGYSGGPPTQQMCVQGQHWGQVGGGLGEDEADQRGAEAGQGEERAGHHSAHGVAHQDHRARRPLLALGRREQGVIRQGLPPARDSLVEVQTKYLVDNTVEKHACI